MKRLLILLSLCFFTASVTPVYNDDPRLTGLVVVGGGAALAGAWMTKKGVERIFLGKNSAANQLPNTDEKKSNSKIFASMLKQASSHILGIPVTALGLGMTVLGIGTIIFSKELLSQTDWATLITKWAALLK